MEAGAFARFRHDLNFGQTKDKALKAYRKSLLDALAASGRNPNDVVVASVFSTQSVTADLEKIDDHIKHETPAPATLLLGPGGARSVFPLSTVTSIVFTRQIGTAPVFSVSPAAGAGPLPVAALQLVPGSVSAIATAASSGSPRTCRCATCRP